MCDHFNNTGRRGYKIIGWIVLGVIAAVVFAFLFGLAVQWLWNKVMVEIFPVPAITYWQAVGLIVLSKLLFGFAGHGHGGKKDRIKRRRDKYPPWKDISEDAPPETDPPA